MKKRFNSNRIGEAKDCCVSTELSIDELIERAKQDIIRNRERLNKYKKHMNYLREMSSAYTYNSTHLNELVGACYIEIDLYKGYLDESKKTLKKLRKGSKK